MKQKNANKNFPTKDALTDNLQDYPKKEDLKREISALETRAAIKMNKRELRKDDKAQKYRNNVPTVMEGLAKELKTIVQELVLVHGHARKMFIRIENHEIRTSKMETI